MTTEATNHYTLTKKQLAILHLLYRFRFATSEQLSTALNVNKNTINKRLKLMLELHYIGRRYEPEDRISRKPAVYYLLSDGIIELKKVSKQKYLPKVLRNIRNDENASDQFMQHCLDMFDIYCTLRAKRGDQLQFFTKTQMAAASYFPKQLPNAHIQLGTDEPKLFLLDLLHQDQPFFLSTRAIIRYISYAEDGDWPTQHEFPRILLICDSASLQKRLLKKMRRRIDDLDNPKLKFYITNLDDLENDVWHTLVDSGATLTLGQI